MANVSVDSISKSGGNVSLKGKAIAGKQVTVQHNGSTLGNVIANNSGDWQITFPSADNNPVNVYSGGRSVNVDIVTNNASFVIPVEGPTPA